MMMMMLRKYVNDDVEKYTDYYNSPSNPISFMTTVGTTSDRLHSEFVRIVFLQTHRKSPFFNSFISFRS
jgi:hypothetical protein